MLFTKEHRYRLHQCPVGKKAFENTYQVLHCQQHAWCGCPCKVHYHLQNTTTSRTLPPPEHYHLQNTTTSRTLPPSEHYHLQNTTTSRTLPPPEHYHLQNTTTSRTLPPSEHHHLQNTTTFRTLPPPGMQFNAFPLSKCYQSILESFN